VWTKTFTTFKHDKQDLSKDEMETFISNTINLFEFFRDGTVSDKPPSPSLEPVYPMAIAFREEHRKRDGLMIYNYQICSPSGQEQPEINLLTPREYIPNTEYYCIPLFNRSTRRWWLDPFLIRCSTLDEVFMDEE
jgi:hypothetical protein